MRSLVSRVLALVAVASIAVAGCTSSDQHAAKHSTSSTRTATTHPVATLPSGVTGATDVPTAVPNKPALRDDVTITACTAAKGGWAAHGTVHNTAKASTLYRVTIFFTTTSATVLGVGRARLRVPAGSQRSWQATGRFTAPKHVLCVLRGVG
jgi:hypothetical protein